MSVQVSAGRDSLVAMPGSSPTVVYGTDKGLHERFDRLEQLLLVQQSTTLIPVPGDGIHSDNPVEKFIDERIDRLRDAAVDGDPDTFIRRFQEELSDLPAHIGRTIRFRLKANIGHRYYAKGDLPSASKWLLDAFEEAPLDPRAVSNKVIGLWAGGEPGEAYRYGLRMLAEDPENELLASYLPQVAAVVADVDDPFAGIPEHLIDTEPLVVAHAIFLRQRDRFPEWWIRVRKARERFPDSDYFATLCAFADVDELAKSIPDASDAALSEDRRLRLESASKTLDEHWRGRIYVLRSRYNDAPYALVAAMIGYQLLRDRSKVIELVESIIEKGLDQPKIVLQAIQIALANDAVDLAEQLINRLPDDPDVAFQAGIVAINDGDWGRASDCFRKANVPASERRMVDAILSLTDIAKSRSDVSSLRDVLAACGNDLRGIVLVTRFANDRGVTELAKEGYRQAMSLAQEENTRQARIMMSSLARDMGSSADVIAILEGHLRVGNDERQWGWLARAHALEHPHRERNVAFFERLDPRTRALPEVSLSYANLLLELGEATRAQTILEGLHRHRPEDTFVTLRLLQAYRARNNQRAIENLLSSQVVRPDNGVPQNEMALSAEIAASGDASRGYEGAYETFRRHPTRGDLAMIYVGLDLIGKAGGAVFGAEAVGIGTCVTIASSIGSSRTFVIDEGNSFFGIDVEPPNAPIVELVTGKVVGDTFTSPRLMGDDAIWTVQATHSKYLELHRRILDQFETRFPGTPGLMRFEVDEDMTNVLELVRTKAEESRQVAGNYHRLGLPLTVAAMFANGNPVAFAEYLRSIDSHVVTSGGQQRDLNRSQALARRYTTRGIALDAYTAWTAAQMDVLPALKKTFGTIHTARSTLDLVDGIIERDREAIGSEAMTVGWYADEFHKTILTDEDRKVRIDYFDSLRSAIAKNCSIHAVVLPDDLSDELAGMHGYSGMHLLDAAIVARNHGALLVSEDAHYRRLVAAGDIVAPGIWLQPALQIACAHDAMTVQEYARAVAGLAMRRHGHVSLSPELLYTMCLGAGGDMHGLRASSRYLANSEADMPSHYAVLESFLQMVWSGYSELGYLQRRAATNVVLEGLLRGRRTDGRRWLNLLIRRSRPGFGLSSYLQGWVRGHFLDAPPKLQPSERAVGRRGRRRSGGA